MRVLYSFPHRIGAGRICYTAWQQVFGLDAAGAEVLAHPASVHRALPDAVTVEPTLSRGRLRVPYRAIGQLRALIWHDRIVARRLARLAGEIDLVHTWPLGALATLEEAKRLGIPTVLERPNAHTRFAFEVVAEECERLGVTLPPDHEHAFNETVLEREEREYELADALLCPSEFVVETFRDRGTAPEKLVRHIYGYDEKEFFPAAQRSPVGGRADDALRRRGRRSQGAALRARGLDPLARLAGRHLPDRRRDAARLRRGASVRRSSTRACTCSDIERTSPS